MATALRMVSETASDKPENANKPKRKRAKRGRKREYDYKKIREVKEKWKGEPKTAAGEMGMSLPEWLRACDALRKHESRKESK